MKSEEEKTFARGYNKGYQDAKEEIFKNVLEVDMENKTFKVRVDDQDILNQVIKNLGEGIYNKKHL